QGQIEVAPSIESDGARTIQGRPRKSRTIRCGLSFSGPANCFDDAGRQVQCPKTMVADVANQQSITPPVTRDAVGLTQLRASRRSAISRKSGIASACDRGD